MIKISQRELWDIFNNREKNDPFVPLVTSNITSTVPVLLDGTLITVPIDSLGSLNEGFPGWPPVTYLEHTLRAFHMELAGYAWLGKVAGCVYMEQSPEDFATVAKLAENRLEEIINREQVKDRFDSMIGYLLRIADLGSDFNEEFRTLQEQI